jgi:hypothetical protein
MGNRRKRTRIEQAQRFVHDEQQCWQTELVVRQREFLDVVVFSAIDNAVYSIFPHISK